MRRLENYDGRLARQNLVEYEVEGKTYRLDADHVRTHGVKAMLRYCGAPDEALSRRLPVMRRGVCIGTLPASFDPMFARQTHLMYQPRPDDFRRDGDTWEAAWNLCPGDFDLVPGFQKGEGWPW